MNEYPIIRKVLVNGVMVEFEKHGPYDEIGGTVWAVGPRAQSIYDYILSEGMLDDEFLLTIPQT